MTQETEQRILNFFKKCTARFGAAFLAVLLGSSTLPAQLMVRQVNLTYLTQRADVIVQGRVRSVHYEPLPGYPNIRTVRVVLDVEDMIRGPAGSTYTFREILLGSRSKEGKRSYRAGQTLLLFLPSPSQYGLSSPIGIEQGRFHIAREGKAVIANEYGNAGLFRNVEKEANRAGIKLARSQSLTAAVESGAVDLDEFVSLVRSLTSLPRIRWKETQKNSTY